MNVSALLNVLLSALVAGVGAFGTTHAAGADQNQSLTAGITAAIAAVIQHFRGVPQVTAPTA